MQRDELVKFLDRTLRLEKFPDDVSNNGLQIEGAETVRKVLFAVDELTGLLGAVALMYPSKSAKDLNLKSVKKKFKDKKFAAGCSRDVIRRGAEQLVWTLDELIERTILAVQSFSP